MKNSVLLHIAGVAAVTLLCACGGEEKKEAKDHVAQAEQPVQVAENTAGHDAAPAEHHDAAAPVEAGHDAAAPVAPAAPAEAGHDAAAAPAAPAA